VPKQTQQRLLVAAEHDVKRDPLGRVRRATDALRDERIALLVQHAEVVEERFRNLLHFLGEAYAKPF
jgi:hypothetical protein